MIPIGLRVTRRYHPDGSPLYDVYRASGRRIGLVRQHPGKRGWFAYFPLDGDPMNDGDRTRREAIERLIP